jgi:primosomal protein N'
MSEATPLLVAAVKFKWQKDDKTYDYFIPADLTVNVGDRVYVETSRGETKVEVVAIKDASDKAEKLILRAVEDLRTDVEKAAKYPNGQRKYSEDRTMLDEKGNRSIFDDVDR